jgi:hypothetical protein
MLHARPVAGPHSVKVTASATAVVVEVSVVDL